MRILSFFVAILAFVGLVANPGAAEPRLPAVDHAPWDELLRQYVDERHFVDYARLKRDDLARLDAYVSSLGAPGEAPLAANQAKALLLNAYNAFTIHWIVRHYPVDSIFRTADPFKQEHHVLGGKRVSLDEIESRLRNSGDPRIHAALVCAARSCPPLRCEAYRADRLDEQLDDNTRAWLADSALNQFDLRQSKARLSSIFKWYGEDFQTHEGGLIGFLRQYTPAEISAALGEQEFEIEFQDYDWGLNDQSEIGGNYSRWSLAWDWVRNLFR